MVFIDGKFGNSLPFNCHGIVTKAPISEPFWYKFLIIGKNTSDFNVQKNTSMILKFNCGMRKDIIDVIMVNWN